MSQGLQQNVVCPACGHRQTVIVFELINAGSDPLLRELLLRGQVNTMACQSCLTTNALQLPLMYVDAVRKLCVEYLPKELFLDDEALDILQQRITLQHLQHIQNNTGAGRTSVPLTVYSLDRLKRIVSLWDVEKRPLVRESQPITREAIDTLLTHLSIFEGAAEISDDDSRTFLESLGNGCWCDQEYDPVIGEILIGKDEFIKHADIRFVKMLLTYCAVEEKAHPGNWAKMLQRGKIVGLLRRLKELRETVPYWVISVGWFCASVIRDSPGSIWW